MRSVTVFLAALLCSAAAWAEGVSQFPIAGKLLEVPVGEGFCAATEDDLRQTRLSEIMGHEMIARTRPLALHLDCAGLASFRAGGFPDSLRGRYWSLVKTAPDSLYMDASHMATYETMLQGLQNATARDLFAKNLMVGARKTDFQPESAEIEVKQGAIGGTVQGRVNADERWHDLSMGLALLPLRGRLLLTTAIETPGSTDSAANFIHAFRLSSVIRPVE